MKTREGYCELLSRWLSRAEAYWDPERGVYGRDLRANAQLLPGLALQAQAGDTTAAQRARSIAARFIATPPWDPDFHYFSNWDSLGAEPHGASAPIASGLSLALHCAEALGLEQQTREAIADVLRKFSRKFADWARPVPTGWRLHTRHLQGGFKELLDRVGGIESFCADPNPDAADYLFVDQFAALHRTLVEKGLKPDLRCFEFWGPDNQECWVMRATAHSYLATGEDCFLRDLERMWIAVVERVEGGCALPYAGAHGFVEDFSFHYAESPLANCEMSLYDHAMLALYGDVIRIQRRAGLHLAPIEEFFRRWARACQSRVMLCDGTSNPALNLAGWERAYCLDWHSTWSWPLAALPDLSLLRPEKVEHIFEAGALAW
ncbi:MAG: hypothetical protein HYW07_24835 [Candidatus Latescibacteria bacterium]|nr:hypothetical protein [Candidatus Latescibacterota bacterium]